MYILKMLNTTHDLAIDNEIKIDADVLDIAGVQPNFVLYIFSKDNRVVRTMQLPYNVFVYSIEKVEDAKI